MLLVHAMPLQVQGLVFTAEPSVERHALAEKQMHLELLLHAVVEVGWVLKVSVSEINSI